MFIKVDLASKPANASLPFHFDKQSKSLLDHSTFGTMTGGFHGLLQEGVIDFDAGTHTGSRLRNASIHTRQPKKSTGMGYHRMTSASLTCTFAGLRFALGSSALARCPTRSRRYAFLRLN
jgi:hypothetical protein